MAENPQHEEDVAEQSSVEFDNLRNTLDLLRANLDSIGNLIKTLPTPLTNLPATNDMFSQLQLAQGCVKSLTTATELMDELYLSLRVHNHEQTLRARPSLSRYVVLASSCDVIDAVQRSRQHEIESDNV